MAKSQLDRLIDRFGDAAAPKLAELMWEYEKLVKCYGEDQVAAVAKERQRKRPGNKKKDDEVYLDQIDRIIKEEGLSRPDAVRRVLDKILSERKSAVERLSVFRRLDEGFKKREKERKYGAAVADFSSKLAQLTTLDREAAFALVDELAERITAVANTPPE
jgi:hypothetical protein